MNPKATTTITVPTGTRHGQANVDRALLVALPVMEAAVVHADPCSHEVSHV